MTVIVIIVKISVISFGNDFERQKKEAKFVVKFKKHFDQMDLLFAV